MAQDGQTDTQQTPPSSLSVLLSHLSRLHLMLFVASWCCFPPLPPSSFPPPLHTQQHLQCRSGQWRTPLSSAVPPGDVPAPCWHGEGGLRTGEGAPFVSPRPWLPTLSIPSFKAQIWALPPPPQNRAVKEPHCHHFKPRFEPTKGLPPSPPKCLNPPKFTPEPQ